MGWLSKFPSLTPIKGLAKFFYVWTHWETISAQLTKRDERLQEIEEGYRQLLRLQDESHKAEKRRLRESHEAEKSELVAKAREIVRHLGSQGSEVINSAMALIERLEKERTDLEDTFLQAFTLLAIMLYVDESPEFRDSILAKMEPRLRWAVTDAFATFQASQSGKSISEESAPSA